MAVVPVKSFQGGKERMAHVLDGPARASLVRSMAEHVVTTIEQASLLPLVVTGSSDVGEWAAARGLPVVSDSRSGLTGAAERGISWAEKSESSWLVIHGDLPLVSPGDIEELAEHLRAGLQPIAPSADGGTSALGSEERVSLSYGVGSFHRHLRGLRHPQVVVTTGLAHDIDTPADLVAASDHPRGVWLRRVLGRRPA